MYAVQIEVKGQWSWAGVEPGPGNKFSVARRRMVEMSRHPYWTKEIGATRFRVRPVPFYVPKPGPRALARKAIADSQAMARVLDEKLVAVDTLSKALHTAIGERDEARKTVEEFAARLGLEVEW